MDDLPLLNPMQIVLYGGYSKPQEEASMLISGDYWKWLNVLGIGF